MVYILIIINLALLTLPFLVAIFPFIEIQGNQIILAKYVAFNPKIALFGLIFFISFFMIIYLILDFIFGFSVRYSLKGCKDYRKKYSFLKEIFEEVKFKFDKPNLKLFIKNDDEINAFAVGSMRKKAMVLTTGLINHYANYIEDDKKLLIALRSILAHEASHLINKDYLPGLLIIINQKITNFAAWIITIIFQLFIRASYHLGIEQGYILNLMVVICNFVTWTFNLFNRLIIMNIYVFLQKFLSRSIEYRCDKQAAKAFGGINMAFALSLLGKSGYFTLFSTHPATQRRVNKAKIIEDKNAIIHAPFFNQLSNYLSILILPLICFTAAQLSNISFIIQNYLYYNHRSLYLHLVNFINLIF